MNPIELSELGPAVRTAAHAGAGPSAGSVPASSRAAPSPYSPGVWQVGPAGKVGAARIGDVEVHIEPKIAIARLLFLVGYSQHGAAWRPEAVPVAEAADLVAVIAQALWRQTERAIHQGLLPGYIVIEESSQVLRGRLRESEQLHRHHGLPLPLEIRHDEFTVDIPENQILRTACERMLARAARRCRIATHAAAACSATSPMSRRCRAAIRFPPGNPLGSTLATTPRCAWPSSSCGRRPSSTSVGGVAVNGFLLDMPKLFEHFVTVALREAIVPKYGGRVDDQDRQSLRRRRASPADP